MYHTVWCVVEAINQLPEFHFEYSWSLAEQTMISKSFEKSSEVGFSNYASCIDELLIWMHNLSRKDAKKAGVGRKKSCVVERGSLVSTVRQSLMIAGEYWMSQLFLVEHHRIAWHLKGVTYLSS
jgi:hypothetical protein